MRGTPGTQLLVPISAKVPAELAEAVGRLADDGNRSLSREIRAAIAEHVARSGGLSSSHRPNPAADVVAPEEATPAVEATSSSAGSEER
jgi:hypothetical protein